MVQPVRIAMILLLLFALARIVEALDPNLGLLPPIIEASGRKLQGAEGICNQAKDAILADARQTEFQWQCECREVSNLLDGSGGSFHLECTSTCGHFCNRRNDVCLIPGFVQGFDANGVNYVFSQSYQYTKGRVEYIDRRVYFNGLGAPLTCQYDVDNNPCQSCEITPCTSGGAPIELHCENLQGGDTNTFNFCTDPTPAVETGVFEFLNPEDFTICSPLPPTRAPTQFTAPPVALPEDLVSNIIGRPADVPDVTQTVGSRQQIPTVKEEHVASTQGKVGVQVLLQCISVMICLLCL